MDPAFGQIDLSAYPEVKANTPTRISRRDDTITRHLLTIAEGDTDLDELKSETDEIVRNLATITEAEKE